MSHEPKADEGREDQEGLEERHEHDHHDHQHKHGHGEHHHEHHEYKIQIDRVHYTVKQKEMTGEQLRHVPSTPIGPDRDLFEVVPGGTDRKIANDEVVEIRDGKRFFTAPAQINPGNQLL